MLFPDEGEIVHEFYNDSSELFSVIQKNLEHQVGITTQTVIDEARHTLNKAMMNTLNEKLPDTEINFERRSIAWNYCDSKMRKLEQLLWKENVPYQLVNTMFTKVNHLYDDLTQLRRNRYEIGTGARAKVRGGNTRVIRNARYRIALEDGLRENYQIERLCRVPASTNDKVILAEAAALRQHYYKAEDGYEMYLASCDSNNFSPAKCQYGIADAVTKQIEKELKISCDWPRQIANKLRESTSSRR